MWGVSTRQFKKGEVVCEYLGELISCEEAKKMEKTYSTDPSTKQVSIHVSHTLKLSISQ